MSFELLPFADVKSLLGLDGSSIASYPDLSIIIGRVQSAFQEYTGRQFEQIERTEEIFVNNIPEKMFKLQGIPIVSVSSFTAESNSWGTETLTDSDYDVTEYGLKTMFALRNCKVTIVYTGGLASVTDILKNAALYQVAYEFQGKEQIGATSVSTEGGSVYRPEIGLLKETKRMLQSSIHPLNVGAY